MDDSAIKQPPRSMLNNQEIQYFSHNINAKGLNPDLNKVKALTEISSPSYVKELHQDLGLINYMGRFLLDCSTKLHPHSDLLKRESDWVWTEVQD